MTFVLRDGPKILQHCPMMRIIGTSATCINKMVTVHPYSNKHKKEKKLGKAVSQPMHVWVIYRIGADYI